MNDRYPSTDERQTVRRDAPNPDAHHESNHSLPVVQWPVAIPHYFVRFVVDVMAFIAAIGAWFGVRFTGTCPPGTFDYVEGMTRWRNRAVGYAFTLAIDERSPFPLGP